MGKLNIFMTRLAALIVLNAAGAGYASPTVLVSRPITRFATEWLPIDNQTVYKLNEGERRSLELNTSLISRALVFLTISPCSSDFHWALYRSKAASVDGSLSLLKEYNGGETSTLSINILPQERYVLQLSSSRGGAAVVSVRGEPTIPVRMRLRVRSRRRLLANWDPSPIDPQSTTYCIVASHRRNYTSLCAAQYVIKAKRTDIRNRLADEDGSITNSSYITDVDNKIEVDTDAFNVYERNFVNVFRRRKFSRSTKVSDEDPVIACVDRTHHLIENLDPSRHYFVSVFGVAADRRAGSLLATGRVRLRTSTAKRLRENIPSKSDVKGKTVYYFKTTIGAGGGVWLTVSTCGGAVDVEVLVRGKRLHMVKSIDPHSKFFVPAPIPTSSIQETSDEGSVQFDSSSEEAKIRYVIKVIPSRWSRDGAVNVEITASTSRWAISTPELMEDGSIVRELRPRRSCRSVDVAFLPATHNATDVIRYCIIAKESVNGENYMCVSSKKSSVIQCVDRPPTRVIIQKINGLKAGRKYAIQVTASNKGNSVPYNMLYVDTNPSCKEEQ